MEVCEAARLPTEAQCALSVLCVQGAFASPPVAAAAGPAMATCAAAAAAGGASAAAAGGAACSVGGGRRLAPGPAAAASGTGSSVSSEPKKKCWMIGNLLRTCAIGGGHLQAMRARVCARDNARETRRDGKTRGSKGATCRAAANC